MPRLRENITRPVPRKLGERMKPSSSKAVLYAGLLLCGLIVLCVSAGLPRLLRIAYDPEVVRVLAAVGLVIALLFLALFWRVLGVGTEDNRPPP